VNENFFSKQEKSVNQTRLDEPLFANNLAFSLEDNLNKKLITMEEGQKIKEIAEFIAQNWDKFSDSEKSNFYSKYFEENALKVVRKYPNKSPEDLFKIVEGKLVFKESKSKKSSGEAKPKKKTKEDHIKSAIESSNTIPELIENLKKVEIPSKGFFRNLLPKLTYLKAISEDLANKLINS